MAEAVHLHKRLTSQVSETSSSFVTKLTLSASDLTTAGFAANDDVLILAWVQVSATQDDHAEWQVTYDGTGLHVVSLRYDPRLVNQERAALGMFRVDLGGTVADVALDLASAFGSDPAFIDKAELIVIRLADFGTENADWYWDESTTDYAHTDTFAATSQASITFTPAAVEDWVVIGCTETQIDSASRNHEYRINMDSGTILGAASTTNVPSEEGEDANENKIWTMFDYVDSLAASEHTIANEVRDDTTGANNTRRSALLVFRAAVWPDLYVNEAGDVTVANDTDVQVATITDTLTVDSQNILMLGHGFMSPIPTTTLGYTWIRQDGTTVIDPVVDFASGLSAWVSFDNSDQPMTSILAYKTLSGTLDLDLFVHQDSAGSETQHKSTLLAWGMEIVAVAAVYPPFPRRQNRQVRM